MNRLGEKYFADILNHYCVVDKAFDTRVNNVLNGFCSQKKKKKNTIFRIDLDLELIFCSENIRDKTHYSSVQRWE